MHTPLSVTNTSILQANKIPLRLSNLAEKGGMRSRTLFYKFLNTKRARFCQFILDKTDTDAMLVHRESGKID